MWISKSLLLSLFFYTADWDLNSQVLLSLLMAESRSGEQT